MAAKTTVVSYDSHPHKYVHFYSYTHERYHGWIFFGQLQLRYNVCLDTVVGAADDDACTRS